jgi:hypothetical protein
MRPPSARSMALLADQPALKLEEVPSTADGVPHFPGDHEDQADEKHDDSDRPQDWYCGDKPNNEKNDANDDHGEIATSESSRHTPVLSSPHCRRSTQPYTLPERAAPAGFT